MPQEQVLQYLLTNRSTQTLDIRGQSVEIASDDIRSISLKSQGREQDQYRIGVTIDSMNMMLAPPQGVIAPDLSGLAGQGLEFSLSTAGLETDFSESESLQYELVPGQKQSAVTGFQALFPNLPSRSVKIGDTWISKDTVTVKTARGELRLIFENKNKLEGFETVDGLKCVRVTADVEGTLDGKGEEQGMELISRADIQGTDTWYFAYEEGIFVKSVSTGMAKGKITGTGPQKIEIPLKRKYSMETRLLK